MQYGVLLANHSDVCRLSLEELDQNSMQCSLAPSSTFLSKRAAVSSGGIRVKWFTSRIGQVKTKWSWIFSWKSSFMDLVSLTHLLPTIMPVVSRVAKLLYVYLRHDLINSSQQVALDSVFQAHCSLCQFTLDIWLRLRASVAHMLQRVLPRTNSRGFTSY